MDAASTLRDARRRAGLSQRELSRRAAVPASVLSAYENGRREPGAGTFLRVLKAAGFEPTLRALPDPEECARQLVEVLGLGEAMGFEPKPLGTARVTWR